jgi:hypothetical protein
MLAVPGRFIRVYSRYGDFKMDQRDQELLDKQLHGLSVSSGNDGVTGLAVLSVFLAGLTIGGFLFAYKSEPMRIASNSFATSAISVPHGTTPSMRQ